MAGGNGGNALTIGSGVTVAIPLGLMQGVVMVDIAGLGLAMVGMVVTLLVKVGLEVGVEKHRLHRLEF